MKKPRLTFTQFKQELSKLNDALILFDKEVYYLKDRSLYTLKVSNGFKTKVLLENLTLREAYNALYPLWVGFQIGANKDFINH